MATTTMRLVRSPQTSSRVSEFRRDYLVIIERDRKAFSHWIADHEDLGTRLWWPRCKEKISNRSGPPVQEEQCVVQAFGRGINEDVVTPGCYTG